MALVQSENVVTVPRGPRDQPSRRARQVPDHTPDFSAINLRKPLPPLSQIMLSHCDVAL